MKQIPAKSVEHPLQNPNRHSNQIKNKKLKVIANKHCCVIFSLKISKMFKAGKNLLTYTESFHKSTPAPYLILEIFVSSYRYVRIGSPHQKIKFTKDDSDVDTDDNDIAITYM